MTIKSEDNKIKKIYMKLKNSVHYDGQTMFLLMCTLFIIVVIYFSLIGLSTSRTTASNFTSEQFAKVLVRGEYPDVLCMATNSGAFRTYKSGTYKIGITDNGWNIWVEPHSNGSAFHLDKCEVK